MHRPVSPRKASLAQIASALPIAALLAGNVALAFGPWFVRLADVGPVAAGFWRVAIAAPILLALASAGRKRPFAPARALWLPIGLGGIAFAADLAAWHLGILRTTLANATLFGNSAILMFPIYGFLAARTWPSRTQGIALGLAAIGAALLLGRSFQLSSRYLVGDLFCLLSGALYTVYFVLMSKTRTAVAPLPALALSTLAGVLPLLIAALLSGERFWPGQWGILIGLALASQVLGQGLVIYAIAYLSPLLVGIALLSQPIVAAAIGWIVYGERLGPAGLVGALLVAIALVLVRDGGPRLASQAEASKSQGWT